MIRILFCNISYLLYYNTRLDRVAPKNGGAYVAKMHDAYEKHPRRYRPRKNSIVGFLYALMKGK